MSLSLYVAIRTALLDNLGFGFPLSQERPESLLFGGRPRFWSSSCWGTTWSRRWPPVFVPAVMPEMGGELILILDNARLQALSSSHDELDRAELPAAVHLF